MSTSIQYHPIKGWGKLHLTFTLLYIQDRHGSRSSCNTGSEVHITYLK